MKYWSTHLSQAHIHFRTVITEFCFSDIYGMDLENCVVQM